MQVFKISPSALVTRLLLVGLSLSSVPAAASDGFLRVNSDAILGGAIGGGAGAAVGSAVGGRDGAIIGSALGAAAGVAIAQPNNRRTRVIREYRYVDDDYDDYHHDRHDHGRHLGHRSHRYHHHDH